ncbi:MAG: hypothetical protein PVF05_12175 [Gemmatimonadales bacterium]|jgi:hypothetical protein
MLIGIAAATLAPGALLAQAAGGPDAATRAVDARALEGPPATLLFFDVPTRAPLVGPLLAQAGCAVDGASVVRIELPGRRFEPPLPLRPVDAGRATPVDALASQWAALLDGAVDRAVAGWMPRARPTARALLSDPDAIGRYRREAEEAARAGPPPIDAIAWLDVDGGPTAVLLTEGASTPYTLGMTVGYRRADDGDFLLALDVALDTRFALLGRAVQEGAFGSVEPEAPPPAGTRRFAEVCRGE